MFAALYADFDDRVREVELYFTLLAALENDEIVIVPGTAQPQNVPPGPSPPDWGRMLKGTAYLVLYNLVEAFIRRGFQLVFDAVRNDGLCVADLSELFRIQWVKQRNRRIKPLDGSPKKYIELAEEIVSDVVNRNVVRLSRDHLPFSGNLDADEIRKVFFRHGVDDTTPAAANAGGELKTVKRKRNDLAHGDVSFEECGRNVAVADLIRAKNEIVVYVRGLLQNLERFTEGKNYRVPYPAS